MWQPLEFPTKWAEWHHVEDSQAAQLDEKSVTNPGERPGGDCLPPLIFRPYCGPKGQKKCFWAHHSIPVIIIIIAAATVVAGWMWRSCGSHLSFLPNGQNDIMWRTARLLSLMKSQWRTLGSGPGGTASPPLFLDHTVAQRAKKNVFEPIPP